MSHLLVEDNGLNHYLLSAEEIFRMRRAYDHGQTCNFDSESEGHDEGIEAALAEMGWHEEEGLNTLYFYGV